MSFWNEKFGDTTLQIKGGVTTLKKNGEVVATTANKPLKKGLYDKVVEWVDKIPSNVGVGPTEKEETTDSDKTTVEASVTSTATEVPVSKDQPEPTPLTVDESQKPQEQPKPDPTPAPERTEVPTVAEVVIETKIS